MIDKVKIFFLSRGYRVVRETSNVVMYRETKNRIYLVLLMEYNGRISNNSYVQAANNLKQSHENITGKNVSFLSICFTQDGMFDKELELVESIQGIWLVAKDTGRIYIFENQPQDFDGVYPELEKECKKVHSRIHFLPYANLFLVLLNIVIFISIHYAFTDVESEDILLRFSLDWSRVIKNGEWYRLLTCLFLHADASHIYGNMLLLFFIGSQMEESFGHVRYVLLYFSTGLVAGIGSMVYHFSVADSVICIGASGAIMGVLGAMTGMLVLCRTRTKNLTLRRLLIFLGLSLAQGLLAPRVDSTAHICGFLAGLLFAFCYYKGKNENNKLGF